MSLFYFVSWYVLGLAGALLLIIGTNKRSGRTTLTVGNIFASFLLAFAGLVIVTLAFAFNSKQWIHNINLKKFLAFPVIK